MHMSETNFIDKNKTSERFSHCSPESASCNILEKGFTLIEVLVAVAIVSVIVAALYSTFFFSQKAISSVDDSLIKLQEARGIVDIIKREIESVFYSDDKSYSMFKIDDRDFFGRQASGLSFTSFSNLMPGVSKIVYTTVENKKKLALTKKITSAYSHSEETKGIDMMEDIESFTVEARYNDKWVKTWDSALIKKIPEAVKIHIVILVNGGKDKVSIYDIAKLKITGHYEN